MERVGQLFHKKEHHRNEAGRTNSDSLLSVKDNAANGLSQPEAAEPGFQQDAIPAIKWVKTNIPGFDSMITNGIPHGSAVLVSGGPGTGKTTFCLQLISNLASIGKKCLYLTFEEDVINLKRHMSNYGWPVAKLENKGLMIIKKMRTFDLSRSVEALLAKASGELTIELNEIEGVIPSGFAPDIIVLDSLSAVAAAFTGHEQGYRIYIEQLFSLFKKIGATAFLITEIEQDAAKYSRSGVEEFLADAVIVFYNIRNKNTRLNALEVLKVRGTSHNKKIVPFKIMSDKGIIVYPTEEAFTS
jgi:circadian clock protein KaiC